MKRAILFALSLLCCALAAHAQAPLRSAGTDFWMAFPNNDPNNVDTPGNLSLYVTAEQPATVRTTMTVRISHRQRLGAGWGFTPAKDTVITRTDLVPAMGTVSISIDTVNNLQVYGVAMPYSVHLTSTAPVRVFTLSHKQTSSDGVTALPTSMLDTEYVLIAHPSDPAGYRTYASTAAFIATADSTYLTIWPSAKLYPYRGSPFVIMLKRGQVYQIASDTTVQTADLTGTIVTGSKPFAALAGVERTWIYSTVNASRSRDHLVEQMLPVKYFGRTYLLGPTGAKSPNRLRVVAAHDSTVVVVNDSTHVLNRGQLLETGITSVSILRASKPVLAVEEEPSSNSGIGDPFSTLVPPMRGWDSLYVTHSPFVRDTASNSVRFTNTFFDTTYWRDTTVDRINRNVADTSAVLDSNTSASQYTLTTTLHDTTYLRDSVYVHNWVAVKSWNIGNAVFYEHHLMAVLRAEDLPNFLVDGSRPIGNLFTPTPYCDYLWFTTKVGQGTHVVSAPHPFLLMNYGYGNADSYGHVAGFRIGADDTLATEALAFGKLRVRTTRDKTTLVRNFGSNAVGITGASIVGRDSAYFKIIQETIPSTLLKNDSLPFTVRFSPDTTRQYVAYLQLCTDISIERIPLTGQGIASRLLFIPPLTNWGTRKAPARYDSSVVICNRGDDSALIMGVYIVGHDTTLFSVDSAWFTLQPGECRTLRAIFHPQFAGSYSADVEARSDSPYDSIIGGQLMAIGAGRVLLVDSVDFGQRLLNSPTVDSQAFILNGSKTKPVRIDSLVLYGRNSLQFRITAPPRSSFPRFLANGESLAVGVQFLPIADGQATANIAVYAEVPCDDILLTGNVDDIIRPQLAGLELDTVCSNIVVDTIIALHNLGTSTIDVTRIWTDDAAFSIIAPLALPVSVKPDSVLRILIHAAPGRGEHNATLSLTYRHFTDTLRVITAALHAYGVGDTAVMQAAQRSAPVAFGDTQPFCFMVYNRGDHALTIDSVAIADGVHFAITTSMPRALARGDSLCLSYTVSPGVLDSVTSFATVYARGTCGPTATQTLLVGYGQPLRVAADSLDLQQVFSCTQRNAAITVRNLSPFNGSIVRVDPTDITAPFTVMAQFPIALPAGSTATIPVAFAPMAAGAYATDFLVTITPRDSSQPLLVAHVSGQSQPMDVATRIDSVAHAMPGVTFTFPIRVERGLAALNLHTVRGTFSYNPRVLQVTGYTTSLTALDGFVIDTFAIDNRHGIVLFHAHHPSLIVTDDTVLMEISAMALVGNTKTTPLPLSIELPDNGGACAALHVSGGLFTSDSVCGLLPVMYNPATALSQNRPNPFVDQTDITFRVGEPGEVLLEIVDQLGRIVRRPVATSLTTGTYTITLHGAELPPGIYYYRLTAPGTRISKQMLILR